MKLIIILIFLTLRFVTAEPIQTPHINSTGYIKIQKGLSLKSLKIKAVIKCSLLDKNNKFLSSQQLDLITILEKNPLYTGKSGVVELSLRGGKISLEHPQAVFAGCDYRMNVESIFNKSKIRGSIILLKLKPDHIQNLNAYFDQDLQSSTLSHEINRTSLVVRKNKITRL